MKVGLQIAAVAIACSVGMQASAIADQWDDLSRKFVDQEQAHLVRRATDESGVVIVLEHPLVSKRVVLVVQEGKPGISFQFDTADLPSDAAFDLMSRGGSLVTGQDRSLVMNGLRQSYQTATREKLGVSTFASDGFLVTCIAPRDSGGLDFLIARE